MASEDSHLRHHALGKVMFAGLFMLAACGGNPDQVSSDDGSSPVGDGGDGGDGGVDESSTGDSTVTDATSDTGESPDTTTLAESGAGEAAGPEASSADAGTTDAGVEEAGAVEAGAPDTGGTVEAGAEAGVHDAAAEASSALEGGAPDAAREASVCTIAGTWSITVQTTTAVPTFCQGVMNCTNCDVQSNATATQPTPSTIQWSVDPGGTLCNTFTGTVSPTGAFATSPTDCAPIGNGTTFDGQIDVATCSMTATYEYVLTSGGGTCTVTYTITGTQ